MRDILESIPHREPFLFVDRIVSETEDGIETEKEVKPDEPFFAGHYPGRPIMPGVLICESVFQSGAALMSRQQGAELQGRVPMVSRINNVKLKHPVLPGDLMKIEVKIKERVGPAFYMTGKVTVRDRVALTLEFTALLVEDAT